MLDLSFVISDLTAVIGVPDVSSTSTVHASSFFWINRAGLVVIDRARSDPVELQNEMLGAGIRTVFERSVAERFGNV